VLAYTEFEVENADRNFVVLLTFNAGQKLNRHTTIERLLATNAQLYFISK